jgi:ribosomal protein S18 acetylase RimI-like enzyme
VSNGHPAVVPSHGHLGRARVRPATPDDLPALLSLWQELREVGGRTARENLQVAIDDVGERLSAALDDKNCRVVVAAGDRDEIQGMAVLCRTSLGPLSQLHAVQLNHVVVAKGHRKRGVGHALVAAAAAYADETGAEQVIVSVSPTLREANRFYARLGFTPAVVRRVAPVAVLRRRLSAPEHPVAALEELTRKRLIARPRRSARRRLTGAGRGTS